MFWKGTDDRLWEMQYTGSWNKAVKLAGAGRLGSPPTAVEDTTGLEHVFWQGTNGTHDRRVDGTECAIQVLRIEGTVHPRTHLLD